MTQVDQWAEEHIHMPPEMFDNRALQMYELLRATNPWLPAPDKVSAGAEIELAFGASRESTLTITVYIKLPEGFDGRPEA